MSKKARSTTADDEPEPIAGGYLDLALITLAAITVFLVAVLFKLDVNRVFDVPKATALKLGGCGIFLVWLLYGLFGRGYPWKSIRIFAGPVFALTLAVTLSTLLSIDVPQSLYGVYERQFGLQGFLGCIGLFVVTATCLRSRRGAVMGWSLLMVIGGVVGSYSLLQRTGHDPFGFFSKPFDKVYSTLGNATFAGNALALIFPMSVILAVVAFGKTVLDPEHRAPAKLNSWVPLAIAFAAGAAVVLALQILPGYFAAEDGSKGRESKEAMFNAGVGLSLTLMILLGLCGSWGPLWARLESMVARRYVDAIAAGGLAASSIGIAIGLVCTRTRGAWVGTFVAGVLGFVVLPFLFYRTKWFQTAAIVCWGWVVLTIGGLLLFLKLAPQNNLYAATIRSIPYAFDPEHTVYGKGQGTRRYLWSESPRVLFEHPQTLARRYRDLDEAHEKVKKPIEGLDLEVSNLSEGEKARDTAWRSILVWPFGIGIETYRYAFMSHKSLKLEALDPMTNHDNPHNNYLYTLASFGIVGLAAYLWLLWRLLSVSGRRFAGIGHPLAPVEEEGGVEGLGPRMIAFGVLTSFFSYAVYSIAGFDSVACSVFLYFFLGCAAAYFNPAGDEPRRSILVSVQRRIAEMRGRDPNTVPSKPNMGASIALAAVLGFLLVHSMAGAITVHAAERAFVGETHKRDPQQKIDDIKHAIELNPYESFYKQSLGGALSDFARYYRTQAQRLDSAGRTSDAKAAMETAERYAEEAEVALYAALDHAWAPENVFISLFQLYYSGSRLDKAEYALERALEHSPHLGAVRANLAVLKLERHAYPEAMRDCKWVLDVDQYNAVALRTCGRASYFLGDLAAAQDYLNRAQTAAPKDPVVKGFLADLEKAKAKAKTATAASSG